MQRCNKSNTYPGRESTFLAKLTPGGAWAWAKGQNYLGAGVSGVAVDANQDIYLTGIHSVPVAFGPFALAYNLGIGEVHVAKLDGAGTWLWATGTGPTVRSNSYPRSVSVSAATSDGAGGLYVAGSYGSGLVTPDTLLLGRIILVNNSPVALPASRTRNGYVARLDAATGAWRWAVQTTGNGDDYLGRPLLDGEGHVYVSGSIEPGVGNGGSLFGSAGLNSAGGKDVVVAQFDTAGRWQWARRTGGPNSETATLCRVDPQERGLLAGTFVGASGQVGPFALTPFNPVLNISYFTAVLGPNGAVLTTRPATAPPTLAVFLNPTRATVSVTGAPPGQPVRALGVLGRRVLSGTAPAQGDLHLALPAGLPAGVYLVRAGAQARRLVVE